MGIKRSARIKFFLPKRKLDLEFDYMMGCPGRNFQANRDIGVSYFDAYVDGVNFVLIACASGSGNENTIYGSSYVVWEFLAIVLMVGSILEMEA